MKTLLAIALPCMLLVGCHSGGRHYSTINPRQHQVAFAPARNVLLTPPVRASLVDILDRHGFTVVTNSTATVFVETDIQHGLTTATAYVKLVKDSKIVVFGRSENYGWGNWVAPGAARENIIQSALVAFDRELGRACIQSPLQAAAP